MKVDRRGFLGALSAGAAGLALARTRGGSVAAAPSRHQEAPPADVDALYEQAVVIDSLTFEEWDEEGIAAWRRSGYTAIHTSLPTRNLEVALKALEEWRQRFAGRPDIFVHCRRAADIERAKREGKLAVLLGFQNATMVEDDVDNVDKLYAAGARCIQLTYNSRNLLGDGCTERLTTGLSDFGIACVERMNDLGIIVDLSHCGAGTTSDGIAFSKKPPCFTHTMCQAIHFHPRAKSDAELRALADRGGVVGLAALGYFVGPRPDTSLEDYLRHIDHAVNVCGIDHVGLCTDFAIRGIEASATRETWYLPRLQRFKPSYNVRWPPWIPELDRPARFRTTAHALAKRGYSAAAIEKILGGNWLRYLGEVLGA